MTLKNYPPPKESFSCCRHQGAICILTMPSNAKAPFQMKSNFGGGGFSPSPNQEGKFQVNLLMN